jgi:hypothetical protein
MAGLNMRQTSMAKEKKSPKKLKEIVAAEAENGGHTAYHHFEDEHGPGGGHPPEGPHIFPAHTEKVPVVEGHLFHHLAQHLHIPHEVVGKEAKEPEANEMEEEEMEAE